MVMTPAPDMQIAYPPAERTAAYDRYGPDSPASPVVISVPHAGRDYPATLLARARVDPAALRRLEDRYADLLVHLLVQRGFSVLVARAPRAMIDLNRNEREIDPAMVRDVPYSHGLVTSAKLRGGWALCPGGCRVSANFGLVRSTGPIWLHPSSRCTGHIMGRWQH